MYQGFFLAPHVAGQALKGAILQFFRKVRNEHVTSVECTRTDLIQSVQFDDKDRMIAFCQAIQYASQLIRILLRMQTICQAMKMM